MADKKNSIDAASKDKNVAGDFEVQLVLFTVGGDRFAIDIMKAKEIIKPVKVTPLPDVPDFTKGVINLRGVLLPIMSMRERLGLSDNEEENMGNESRIIIVAIKKMLVGIIVDFVEEIIRVPLKDVQPPPKIAKGIDSRYLLGMCRIDDEALVLLDLDKILSSSEKVLIEGLKANSKSKGKKNKSD